VENSSEEENQRVYLQLYLVPIQTKTKQAGEGKKKGGKGNMPSQ
jgi:hypothetical protein